jgi:hypothetical protein
MRIGTISAIALCLVTSAATIASAGQRGHGATPHAARPAPQGGSHTPTTTTSTTTQTHGAHRPATTTTTTPTTTTTTTTTRLNPIAAKISSHPQQAARIQQMLPQGMTLNQASRGFRNQGQFIAALHVSQNLNIPFRDLRRAMTGPNAMSLGQAIHTLRPSANSTVEANRANHQTTADLR